MKKYKIYVFVGIMICFLLSLTGCRSLQERLSRARKSGEIPQNTEGITERDREAETDLKMETEQEAESEIETESESELKAESEMESKTELEAESKIESGSERESETKSVRNGHTVGIDPGHQGSWVDMSATEPDAPGSSNYKAKSTTGTQGRYTGVPEYQLNLDISLALREELEVRGYQVVMTREDNDTAISNIERAQKAADGGSEIYVRIHANGSDDTSVNGALAMAPSPQNPYVADLAEDSYRLSESILNSYCESTGFANLGIQYYDNMTGINWSTIPVMILEMGFMTNQSDDLAMQDPSVQQRMVRGIADGIDAYFGIHRTENTQEDISEEDGSRDAEGLIEDEIDGNRSRGAANALSGTITELYKQFLAARETAGEKWAVSIENLSNHRKDSCHGDEKLQSASVIKVFIMGAVYDRMCYPSSPKRLIPTQETYDGELRYLLEQMITVSSNEAANELVLRLGEGDFSRGAAVVNQFCRENGYTATFVGRRFLEENPVGDNYTSANDCRKILEDIYNGSCVCSEASEKMLTILKQQTNLSKIPAGLPEGFSSANKTGEMPLGYGLGCIENDMAIIFSEKGDYILVVLSNDLDGRNEEARQVIAQIAAYTAKTE